MTHPVARELIRRIAAQGKIDAGLSLELVFKLSYEPTIPFLTSGAFCRYEQALKSDVKKVGVLLIKYYAFEYQQRGYESYSSFVVLLRPYE